MRLVLRLLHRRNEILGFEITELLLSVMGELSILFYSNCAEKNSLSPVFRKQSVFLCEDVWIKRTYVSG